MDIGIHMEGSMGKLAHKVAVVTGASKGIGAYDKEITALLLIDPYNDFISEGGKLWGRIRAVAEANGGVPHMLQLLHAAREARSGCSMRCIIATVPATTRHGSILRQFRKWPGREKTFEYGTWGGEMHPGFKPKAGEIVATEELHPVFGPGFTRIFGQDKIALQRHLASSCQALNAADVDCSLSSIH